jgi:uncharacterized protein (TIGR02246 family)
LVGQGQTEKTKREHALAALFAEDADFTNVRGEHAGERKAIEDMHAPLFTGFVFKGSHLTGELHGVRFLKPDIAVADVPILR